MMTAAYKRWFSNQFSVNKIWEVICWIINNVLRAASRQSESRILIVVLIRVLLIMMMIVTLLESMMKKREATLKVKNLISAMIY